MPFLDIYEAFVQDSEFIEVFLLPKAGLYKALQVKLQSSHNRSPAEAAVFSEMP